jgi:hypothetical protein
MTDQETRDMAGGIRRYVREREAARSAAVQKPAILSEKPPADPNRLAGWKAIREQSDREYTDALLSKGGLSGEEQAYIGARIAEHFKNT